MFNQVWCRAGLIFSFPVHFCTYMKYTSGSRNTGALCVKTAKTFHHFTAFRHYLNLTPQTISMCFPFLRFVLRPLAMCESDWFSCCFLFPDRQQITCTNWKLLLNFRLAIHKIVSFVLLFSISESRIGYASLTNHS